MSKFIPNKNFFIEWYEKKGRDLPWRQEGVTNYQIVVTEILLKQTQAKAVATMWNGFFCKYPTIDKLADTNSVNLYENIKELGLGKQRASGLIDMSQWIIDKHDSQVPCSLDDLMAIPHIGQYSANAILCFACGQKAVIVDTNILRFFSRYLGIEVKKDIRRNPIIWDIARQLLPRAKRSCYKHNYGLLDFTDEICRSKKAQCNRCPLNKTCNHFKKYIQTT